MSKARAYFAVFSAATFFLFVFINMNSFNALNEILRNYYNADALQISNLSAMYFYANILFLIPSGLVLDRFSTRKVLLSVLAICIVATILFSWNTDFHLALLLRFIIGACSTVCLLSTAKLTSRWFDHNQAAFVMGLVVTFAMLGGVIAQQIPWLINVTGSWQWAMTAVGILGVIFWLAILIWCHDDPPGHESDAKTDHDTLHQIGFWKSLWLAIKNPQTWLAGIYTNLLTIPIVVMGALWVKSYLKVVYAQDLGHGDIIASMIFLGVLIGSPVAGKISDKMGKRRLPMILGAVLTLIVSLAVSLNSDLGFTSLCVLFFLMGFFSGSQVITYALVMEINPKHLTASSEALASTIIMAAGAIFQPLFGYVMLKYWDGTMKNGQAVYDVHAYNAAMWILPIAFVVSVLIAFLIKEPRKA